MSAMLMMNADENDEDDGDDDDDIEDDDDNEEDDDDLTIVFIYLANYASTPSEFPLKVPLQRCRADPAAHS